MSCLVQNTEDSNSNGSHPSGAGGEKEKLQIGGESCRRCSAVDRSLESSGSKYDEENGNEYEYELSTCRESSALDVEKGRRVPEDGDDKDGWDDREMEKVTDGIEESGPSIPGLDDLTSGERIGTESQNEGVHSLPEKLQLEWSDEAFPVKKEPMEGGCQDYFGLTQAKNEIDSTRDDEDQIIKGDVKSEHSRDSNGGAFSSAPGETMANRRFVCTVCDKTFKGNGSLVKHYRVHTGEKPFNCIVCSKAFAQKSNLKTHSKTHSGDKSHSCSVCNKGFISQCDLLQHTSVHTGHKRYPCPEVSCQKGFNTKYKLKIHLRAHTGERPYHCSVCGKDFTRPYDLKIHFRTHTEEKNHRCGMCEKRFKRNSELTAHIRTHTGEKPYTCSICFRAFAESGSLANHKRLHTGEMPYSCGMCNKAFHHSSNLKRHMKSHIGDKPFECVVCQRCFTTRSDLKRHGEIHLDDQSKRFMCSICSKGFRRSDHLKKHMKMHFGELVRKAGDSGDLCV